MSLGLALRRRESDITTDELANLVYFVLGILSVNKYLVADGLGRTVDKPRFKSVKVAAAYSNPEEMFYTLSGRSSTHGYLRGPQQDVLREYADQFATATDVAFELPTGTGKTAVGLLVAEWQRLSGKKAAFLCLTNQLAGQVLAESQRMGIACADLRGTRETRSAAEEGRYRTGEAVAVTTYSNLFNVNPVLQECDLLVFDDAHGAENYVADNWTVSANAHRNEDLYNSLLAALRPGLTDMQVRSILDRSGVPSVELVDRQGHPECLNNVVEVLDAASSESRIFPWTLIRNKLHSCVFLVSPTEITIRPLVPPTHMHAPFASAKQRIYMSATLGGESDLQRAYGIERLSIVRAKSRQWGRRYVFVPGVYATEDDALGIVSELWDSMQTRRAVVLAPSERVMSRTIDELENRMVMKPARLQSEDIANSMDEFVNRTDVILALAGRYDGLDLPDDQCRLLVLSHSPAAINPLERHLSQHWKMGPILRKRERTRLIQGMGRCTRNATDFAIIIWLGQSLVNAAASPSMVAGFPPEIAAELMWGVQQSELAAKDADGLIAMLIGLLSDNDYRKAADASIAEIQGKTPQPDFKDYEEAGADEVRYAKAMWDGNFEYAVEIAHGIADTLNSAEIAGYRAWWWYLASIAAAELREAGVEQDSLRRGASCGVNAGWLNSLLRQRKVSVVAADGELEPNAEAVWDLISKWGWAGPTFEKNLVEMIGQLHDNYHVAYHQGLEALGKCCGAQTTRSTEPGAPDVVWSFSDALYLAFEAKTGKQGTDLSKKEVQNARGHIDWVRAQLSSSKDAKVETIVVAPTPSMDQWALPFAEGVFYCAPDEILKLAELIAEGIRKLRVKFAGREYPEAAIEFSHEMRSLGFGQQMITKLLLATLLRN